MTTDKNQNPEQIARDKIDFMLKEAGWIVQSKNEVDLGAGRGVAVREYQAASGFADYILFVDKKPVGIIEAKKADEGHKLTVAEDQSLEYANAKLKYLDNDPLPFVFESTGTITRFRDLRDPKPRGRNIFWFFKPETLADWLQKDKSLRARLLDIPALNEAGLRPAQIKAIKNLETSFKKNKPKALIQMATGAGKTFTAATFVYRLLEHAKGKRILFLVDTKNLGEQAEQEFMAFQPNESNRKFTELYNVQRLTSSYIASDSQVCISTIQRMYAKLKGSESKTDSDKKAKAKLNYIKNNFEKNLDKYEAQEAVLKDRNSYSKTDEDATFMRMKDDHMMNGQLKPAYNAQISTENQIIVNYTIHQQTNDFNTLEEHLENFKKLYGEKRLAELKELTADAGYGSEQNYELLEQNQITPFVKYNTFDKEQDAHYQAKHKTFSKENLHYNREKDFYVCPMGQKMEKTHESTRKTKTGYPQKLSHYRAKNCQGCPIRGACHSSKENRSVERNHHLEQYKEKIRELLNSEQGIKKRKQRSVEVEPVFAHLKHCNNFKRFTLRGLKKVELEFGLHALAHNLRKKVA